MFGTHAYTYIYICPELSLGMERFMQQTATISGLQTLGSLGTMGRELVLRWNGLSQNSAWRSP